MKKLNFVLIALIALLSIAAGCAKVMSAPQEVAFLQGFGFNTTLIIIYGLVQIIGGILLVISKTKILGATISIVAFTFSSILIFVDGNVVFGLVSLLPIALIGFIFWQSTNATEPNMRK